MLSPPVKNTAMLSSEDMENLYDFTVPVFINQLNGLKNVLTKAEAHAKEAGLDEATLLNDALIADMFPLKKQVQLSSDHSKGTVARLSGKENPKMEDTEATFAELQSRLDKTIEFIQSVSQADFVGAEERQIILHYYPGKYMLGKDYARFYALPNFMFHVTTAYGIIRKNGVQIGKADFANELPFHELPN